MAFIFADSFDHYATADVTTKWTQLLAGSGGTCAVAAVGRHSSNGWKVPFTAAGGGAISSPQLALTPTTPVPSGAIFICGFAFRMVNAFNASNLTYSTTRASSTNLCVVRQGGNDQFWMRPNSNATVSVYRGTTLLGTTAAALTQNVYTYIELKVTLSATVGTVDVYFNGINVLSLTGQNTNGAGTTTWDEFWIGTIAGSATSGLSYEMDFDDLYILDGSGSTSNAPLGDVRVDVLLPNAAGDLTNWTPNASTNVSQINEATFDGDTSFNTATAAATIDTYKTATQPVSGANIFAIQVNMLARKTDAGAAGLKPVIRISSSNFLGTEQGIPSSYKDLRQIYDINPSTSVAWVDADIGPSKAQFGIDKST